MENDDYKVKRELSIRKIIIVCFVVLSIIAIIVVFSLYISEEEFRKWVDINVLKKDVNSEDVISIDLDTEKNNQIYCYNRYICILKDKNLSLYNSFGENIAEISVDINTALFDSNNKYLAIAEKNGQEFCVLLDKTQMWRQKIDGEILQIHINKNGYVAVVTTDTTYKSIITVYDSNGTQLLRDYLSSTRVVDVTIDDENKYVAFAEMDTSGTLIQSNIKVISIENIKQDSEDAIVYTYEAQVSKMIVKIQYQGKNELICVYNDSIDKIINENSTQIVPIDNNITFMSGDLNKNIAYITEETSGMFKTNSVLHIVNTEKNENHIFNFEEITKEMYTCDNIIGINIGTEVYFVNTNGMLIKKYISNQEITNIMLSNNLAIIIYKNRIEIVDL